MPKKQKVAVIGAGIAGMASAIRLAKRGYNVHVYEKSSYPGGKIGSLEQKGYRFDKGPSLLTLPELIDDLFCFCGKSSDLSYKKLEVITKYFYPDQTNIYAYSDVEKLVEELELKLGEPKEKVRKFLNNSRQMYDWTKDLFLFNSIHKLSTHIKYFSFANLWRFAFLGAFTNMHSKNHNYFKNPKTTQLFDRYATYNGSNPYKAPSTLNIISHLEHNLGAFFLDGGMHSLTKSLYRLATDMGVFFHFDTPVCAINIIENKAISIEVKSKKKRIDLIVCNTDVYYAYKKLMPSIPIPKKVFSAQRSSSAMIFYWGISKTFSNLDIHNILFSENYRKEFDYMERGDIYYDPTVYIYISSKLNVKDAPLGCENWFVMINVSYDKGQNWQKMVSQAREYIFNKINRQLNIDIRPYIDFEKVCTPEDIDKQTSSYLGSLYGNSSNSKYAAFLRHPNFSRKVDNVYFCGGSVHPGGGIPLCLLSAKIVTELIDCT